MATYQRILMPMLNVNVTQKEYSSFSHKGINAIDLAGKNALIESVHAPVDMKIVKMYKYNSMGNCVIATSINKVLFADGTLNYATFQFMHDNNINDLKVGQVIKQWQVFYQEGTTGFATGNHIHLAVKKGKFEGLSTNGWSMKNAINTQKAFVLVEGLHRVINLLGNSYRKVKSRTYTKPTIKVWSVKRKYKTNKDNVKARLSPSSTGTTYKVLNKKSKAIAYYGEITTNGFTWYVFKNIKGQNTYVAAKNLVRV